MAWVAAKGCHRERIGVPWLWKREAKFGTTASTACDASIVIVVQQMFLCVLTVGGTVSSIVYSAANKEQTHIRFRDQVVGWESAKTTSSGQRLETHSTQSSPAGTPDMTVIRS